MKRNSLPNFLLVLSFLLGFTTTQAQTANVQIIHNCADPLADTVDIYLNGTILLNNFAFRNATPFVQAPAGAPIVVGVAGKNSTSVTDTLKSFTLGPLMQNANYVVVASGVVGTGFAANPNSRSIALDLKVIASARTAANNNAKVDFAIFHGATDAPSVDAKLSGGGATLASGASYGDATPYLEVAPTWYPIDILPAGGSTPVASYVADLSGLTGGAAVVLASGFLNPSANNNGPAFALIAALANGDVVTLPVQQFANVQAAHNCASPAAASVDVYIDGAKAVPNFAFRTATPFIPLLAGVNHSIAIAPPNSSSVSEALATFDDINLAASQNYIVVASGVVGTGFAANPDGRSTAFTLDIIPSAQTVSPDNTKTGIAVYHGSTDAPTVDVKVLNGSVVVDNASYGDNTGYLSLTPTSYVLQVQDSGNVNTVASFVADISTLAGQSGVIYASGFLTPSANNNGPGFGLFLSLASGGNFIPLDLYTGIENVMDFETKVFPNPTSGNLLARFTLPKEDNVAVTITDLSGREVKQVATGYLSGNQQLNINTTNLANGNYLLQVKGAKTNSVTRFVVCH